MARVLLRSSRPMASSRRRSPRRPAQHLLRRGVELDRNQGEFAVLARRQVDLATQLVFEVGAVVEAGVAVAQRLVGDFAAQLFVGTLLLLELLERRAQLRLALPLRRQVAPDAAQPAAPGRRRPHSAWRSTLNSRRTPPHSKRCSLTSGAPCASAVCSAARSAVATVASNSSASLRPTTSAAGGAAKPPWPGSA